MLFIASMCRAQIKLPSTFSQVHPRLYVNRADKEKICAAIRSNDAAQQAFNQLKAGIDPYVTRHQTDSIWMVSRLQMYWKTKSIEVYIRGGVFDHAAGEASVPTVKFPGSRGGVTVFAAPKLEDMMPYMDDPRGVYLVNKSKTGEPLEWTDIANTGRTIDGINTNIMGMANTAALVYWITGEEKYARFALALFDMYMTGMYYRSTPKDLSNGHDYFYHNMGQQVTVAEASGKALNLQPTDKLSFSGGHLFAYDYFWDKKSIATDKDVQAVFNLEMPGKAAIQMNMWMKGEKDREIFAVKAPKSRSIDRMGLPEIGRAHV